MKIIKKSFNINPEVMALVDAFIQDNPGVSFTSLVNKALKMYVLYPPQQPISVGASTVTKTEFDADAFLNDNTDLMNDLAK